MRTISEQRLNWRRDKVRELSVRGYSQRKIAEIMKISSTLVNEDLQFLRKRAKGNITTYIDEYLPAEYENCLDGLNNILTEAWLMSMEGEKRERMQALALAKECYAMKLDLLSSATVIDRAVKFVDNHIHNNNNGLGRGLTQQSKEVVKMTLQNLNRILDKYELQLGSTNVQQFELLKELSFYNWQKQPQLLPSGNCGLQQLRSHNCSRNFNTEIGLPQKNWQSYPLFDYEQLLFDTLRQHKHVWIKKATGLGITEFMLRYMAWLCTSTNKVENSQMCIVTGPRIELAITLIDRMKGLFRQNIQMQFDTKETVIELNGVHIEAYPSHHLDSMRGLTDVSFIYLDEADFFPPGQQQDARDVSERYIAKSNPWIVMVSTPNAPDGLFEKIEREPENTCLYKRLFLDYKYGLDRIYSREEIERAKTSPSFEREYNLKYLGKVGNVFHALDIEASICTQREGQEMMDWSTSIMVGRSMGIDVAWGDTSQFAIVITQFRNRKVEVIYAETYEKPQMNYIINHIMQLKQRHHITKIYVDGANPEVIRELKSRIGEYHDYYGRLTEEDIWSLRTSNSWQIIPVNFQKRHKEMLQWTYTLMSKKFIKIHPSFHELIVSLRTATVSDEWKLDKQQTSRIRVWVSLFVLGMLGLRPAESGRYLDHRTEGHEFIPPTNPDVAFHILFCTNVPTKDHLICI